MLQDADPVATHNRNPVRANREFIKLIITPCCDIVTGMQSRRSLGACNLSPALRRFYGFSIFQPKHRRTAREQRTPSLFLHSPDRRRPRISAGKDMSTADKLPQKQQKQREVPCAVGFVQLTLMGFRQLGCVVAPRRARGAPDCHARSRSDCPRNGGSRLLYEG